MNPNLLPNRPLDNYVEQDSFNFLTKAEAIKSFLEQNSSALEKNKMLVLYGDWGSGKTSLMRYIENTIDKNIYQTIFFEAWAHEKDENLALSLCDSLTETVSNKFTDDVKEFMKGAFMTLKGFASGVTLKLPSFISSLGLDLEISGEKITKAINEEIDKSKNPSFYKNNKIFKETFIKVENAILNDSNTQKIIVFVDDLDRCEPENVLNLITALKLFFTYGQNTIFFCGMDKDAVAKAVKTKYKEVIKSEEYLEKVFDVAFNMPKTFSIQKMLDIHFKGDIKLLNGHTVQNTVLIEEFLKTIRFTNPRHLKKLHSKYEIIKSFKILPTIPEQVRSLIPNILHGDNEGNIFETIFCLFFIIMYEFRRDDFIELESYEEKMTRYIDPIYKYFEDKNKNFTYNSAIAYVSNNLVIKDYLSFTIKSLSEMKDSTNRKDPYLFTRFIMMFSHSRPNFLTDFSDSDLNKFQDSFQDKEFLTLYCKFLVKYRYDILHHGTGYPIWNLFDMANYLL